MTFATLKLAEFGPDPLREERPAPERPIRSVTEQLTEAHDEGYGKGFKDGVRTTTDALSTQQQKLDAAVLEAISDAELTAHAARTTALASLEPLVKAIAGAAMAANDADRLAGIIADHLDHLRARAQPPELVLTVHPDHAEANVPTLADAGLKATLRTDDSVARLQAQVHWNNGFDRLDLAACQDNIDAAIATFFTSDKGETDHDRRTA